MPLVYVGLAAIYVYPTQTAFARLGLEFLDTTHAILIVIGGILFLLMTYSSPGKLTSKNMGNLAYPAYIKRHYSRLEQLSKLPGQKQKDGKQSSPWPDFSDPVYNGLRDQDREKTSYGEDGSVLLPR